MLNIYFGQMDDVIYNTSMYFDNVYLDSWIQDEFAQRIIKNIDKGVVISPQAVDTKALGVIPVTQLSGGTKTLLLINFEQDKIFNASTCGDNCAKWILRIAKRATQDITINLRHIMNFGDKNFEIRVLNSDKVVHNMAEYVLEAGEYIQ